MYNIASVYIYALFFRNNNDNLFSVYYPVNCTLLIHHLEMDNLKKYVKKKKDAFSETPKITKISRKKYPKEENRRRDKEI